VFEGLEVLGGDWHELTVKLPAGEVGSELWYRGRPVKLSLYNAGQDGVVEVDDLRLAGQDGHDLLANGDFGKGMDRWFFSADVDLPWHIWSLPVAVLFEMGWLGVGALGGVVLLALGRMGYYAFGEKATVLGPWIGALLGLGVLCIVDSVGDGPRMLMLGWIVISCLGGTKFGWPRIANHAMQG
jgi:hypothetical protein